MDIDLSQFRESFLAECGEHIGLIEEGLLELQAGDAEPDRLNAIFRAAHSVKGAAGTFGWTAIVRLTHAMEDLLDRMRSSRLEVSPALVRLLLSGVDKVKEIMSHQDEGDSFGQLLDPESLSLAAQMKALLDGNTLASPEEPHRAVDPNPEHEYQISFIPSPRCFQKGINPLLALRELADFGMIDSCDIGVDALPALSKLDPMVCYLGWTLKLHTTLDESEVRTAFSLIDGDAEVTRLDVPPEIGFPSRAGEKAKVELPEIDLIGDSAPEPKDFAAAEPAAARKETATKEAAIREGAKEAPAPAAAAKTSSQTAQSIRVPAEKVDHLIDLTGELVIAYSMANEVLSNFTIESLPRLKDALAAMERGTRELQERVMSVRMMPAASVFQRFPRLVYDIAAKTGKQIAIQISGADTELDKTVAEQLLDPLTHLIRNSADHGVETPEERREAGKPEQGQICLSAYHQAGKVVIEITDDGKGLDHEKIRAKAISKGLISPDTHLTENESQMLIFAPGFSTKDQVSDLSGRGVGMDVVKRNIESLNGSIRVESTPGRGTTVRLYLPLTLAIVDGLLLRVGTQSFALPFGSVVESIKPKSNQIIRMGVDSEERPVLAVILRSETIPLVALGHLFAIEDAIYEPTAGLLVIVESGTHKLALLTDDIVGHQQFVIKSVEKNFRRVEGALGATILGDGTVALIIDSTALWHLYEMWSAAPNLIAA